MLTLTVVVETKPESTAQYRALAREHAVRCMKREEGCLAFTVYEHTEKPDCFMLHESYADQEALDNHNKTDYLKTFRETAAPWIVSTERTLWKTVSPAA